MVTTRKSFVVKTGEHCLYLYPVSPLASWSLYIVGDLAGVIVCSVEVGGYICIDRYTPGTPTLEQTTRRVSTTDCDDCRNEAEMGSLCAAHTEATLMAADAIREHDPAALLLAGLPLTDVPMRTVKLPVSRPHRPMLSASQPAIIRLDVDLRLEETERTVTLVIEGSGLR